MDTIDDFKKQYKTLNKNNIDNAITAYEKMLETIPPIIQAENVVIFFKSIKQEKIGKGPYPSVSLFEAGNRIMTDLVILYGVKDLLEGKIKGIHFDEYHVEYGNDRRNKNDIIAVSKNLKLHGEAFHVSRSFFYGKKSRELKKLRENKTKNTTILIMYNADAVEENYAPQTNTNEYHVRVQIPPK